MKKREGMTFIEVLISILLLGIISISILPMASYSVKFTKWNNIRLNALNLAYTQVEWLKSLEYDDIGLNVTGYSPHGIVDQDNYMDRDGDVIIGGIKYNLYTNIYWQKEISTTGEPVPQAIKKVDVTVEAIDIDSGKQKEYAVLGTLITREGERGFSEPGNVEVYVYMRSPNNPEKSVRVGMGISRSPSYFSNSDEDGKVLFGGYSEGDYFLEPISWRDKDIVVLPNGVEGTQGSQVWKTYKKIYIPKWNKDSPPEYPKEDFLIDFPAYLDILNYKNSIGDFNVEIKPSGESYIPNEDEGPDYMTLKTKLKSIKNMKFWRNWQYIYEIKYGNNVYFFEREEEQKIWDGNFNIIDLNNASFEKVNIVFGIDYVIVDTKQSNGDEIESIKILFTSTLNSLQDMEFLINDELIGEEFYEISDNNNEKEITLNFKEGYNINTDEIRIKINNYSEIIDTNGIPLSNELSSFQLR